MKPTQIERIDRCIDFLTPLAQRADEELEPCHWIEAHSSDPDQTPSYCRACCKAKVAEMNAEHPGLDYYVTGGYRIDSDGPDCCEECGKRLDVALTDYGVEEGLQSYSGRRIDLRGSDATYEAYELLELLQQVWTGEPEDVSGIDRLYRVERQKRTQRKANALARRIDVIRVRLERRAAHDTTKGGASHG